jgi:hypothetical protein
VRSLRDVTYTLILSVHGDADLPESWDLGIPRVRLVTSKGNCTLSDVLNAGVAAGGSPYIARLDSDDLTMADRLAKQASFLEQHDDCVAVGSDALEIDGRGSPVGYRRGSGGPSTTMRLLRWRNPVIHPSVMFRRSAFIEVGGYSPIAALTEDFDLWLRMAALGGIESLEEPLIAYRVHPDQTSSRGRVSDESQKRILKSRLALARARHESQLAARIRHRVWYLRHQVR